MNHPPITKPDTKKSKARSNLSNRSSESFTSASPPSSPKNNNPRHNSILIDDKYILNNNDYEIIDNKKKKSGGFGFVNFVQHKHSGKIYAAKTSFKPNEPSQKKYVYREINILAHALHPTIVHFHGVSYKDFQGQNNLTIFTDYMENGSLSDILRKERKSLAPHDFDNTKKQIILAGIARGMIELQKLHIIHRDLKPANVLLDQYFKPYITDFGLSKIFNPGNSRNQSIANCGTTVYMAPEVILSDSFNYMADVYSFGILMYEVVTGNRPYSEIFRQGTETDFRIKDKILRGERPKFPPNIKKSLKQMIEKCWSKEPNDRPTFSELYSKLILSDDDFFVDINGKICEPVINVEEIISDDEDDDDVENELKYKYCFDDIDVDELFDYVTDVNNEEKIAMERRDGDFQSLREEIKKIEDKVSVLKNENKKLKSGYTKLEEDNKKLKKDLEQLKEIVTRLKSGDDIEISTASSISQYDLEMQCLELTEKVKNGQTTVYLPRNLKRIPKELFRGCKELRHVIIPPTVTSIGDQAFFECNSLMDIELPPSLETIGNEVFYDCISLKEIEIPPTVKSIGESSFCKCSSLSCIRNLGSVESIGNLNFNGCKSLANLEVPKKIIDVQSFDFYSCNSLKGKIVIPKKATSIRDNCFAYCENITEIDIPDSVTSIGKLAFINCKSLKSITIPSSVKTMGYLSFQSCESLQTVEIPDSVQRIKDDFINFNYDHYGLFRYCKSLKSFKIPPCLQHFGLCSFQNCELITEIIIPYEVESIGISCFHNCKSLKSVKMHNNIRYIGTNAFRGCISFHELEIPKQIYQLPEDFFNETSIKTVIFQNKNYNRLNYHLPRNVEIRTK